MAAINTPIILPRGSIPLPKKSGVHEYFRENAKSTKSVIEQWSEDIRLYCCRSRFVKRVCKSGLALKVGVSQSGIIKFAQKLGFKGFTALKLAIIEDLAQQKAILEPKRPIHNKIHSDDSH